MHRSLSMFIFTVLVLGLPHVSAQQVPLSYYLPVSETYDPSIPTPEAFFGFQVGKWHLQPGQVHAYINELARVSDRITVTEMGRTHEDREMLLAVITAPSNHADLERIQADHLSLSDPEQPAPAATEDMPVIVWMGYSVHGNEASGSNASVLVAYYLAAAQSDEVRDALGRSVILLNPSINPDGLNRFASWVNANKSVAVDPFRMSREHLEPWPGGRTNHYWFDLNRDWMPLQHPESRARIEQYYRWRPNILTDHHEMGSSSTFFFQPGIPRRSNPLTPSTVQDLTARIATFHARALDSIGSLYYSRESFDDFYVGKGSTYPDITGGVGILFEQASVRGHAQSTDGGLLTFPFAIRNQVTTSLSTLRAAVSMRAELLAHQRDMAESAVRLAKRSGIAAYVFGSGSDMASTEALARILHGHAIEVYELADDVKAAGKTFRAGQAFVVPVQQVQYRLITSLFERRTEFEDSLFYDVSAWSLPLAFGLPGAELRSLSENKRGRRFDPRSARNEAPSLSDAMIYAFPWTEFYAPRALNRLFEAGIVPRMAFEPFAGITSEGEVDFDRGTIIVAVGPQTVGKERIRNVLKQIDAEDRIPVHALRTGQSRSGVDLGSPNVVVLQRPGIALLAGPGISYTDAGEIWHLFDNRYGFPVTLLDPRYVRRSVLKDFSVVIMPGGRYGDLDSQQTADLRTWIQDGNTLVALEQAVSWTVRNKIVNVPIRESDSGYGDTATIVPYDQQREVWGARRVPGAIVAAKADLTHPLMFGRTDADIYLFKSSGIVFEASSQRARTPVLFGAEPLVSGYLHSNSIDHIRSAGAIAALASGRGRVILFADTYAFRGFWFGTSRVLTNAVLLGPYMRVPSSDE